MFKLFRGYDKNKAHRGQVLADNPMSQLAKPDPMIGRTHYAFK
jgi:hypothetical protein